MHAPGTRSFQLNTKIDMQGTTALNIGAFIPDYRLLLTIGDATGSGFQHQRISRRFADSLARKCLYRAPEARCKPPFSTQTGISGKKYGHPYSRQLHWFSSFGSLTGRCRRLACRFPLPTQDLSP
jgi:hypothetical protein